MMENIVTILSVIAVSAITLFLGNLIKREKPKQKPESPPKNKAADIARGTIQQTFQEEVEAIREDTASAQRLAARANARKRRK
jgi:hypothetical protein